MIHHHGKYLQYLLEIYRARKDKEGAFNPEMVDQLNCDQDTPMHLVCHNGYMEVATLLHEHGARLDTLDKDKRTSLHRAAAEGQTLVAKNCHVDFETTRSQPEIYQAPKHHIRPNSSADPSRRLREIETTLGGL
ncbi:ankyrin repeat protein [Ancylostoma ceylanicum]|uniref:Ankyrin repeat protein n=1 Tax=Ancylostoma ceylanicum TaxID=53326 RepID=A0A0D6LCZ4_9BILA|nr:ankyrin repeat protein [Ancylostoma ceylanicum]